MTHEQRVAHQQQMLVDAFDLPGLAEAMIDLQGQIVYLLDTQKLWSPEGLFTFPNGETIERKDWDCAETA